MGVEYILLLMLCFLDFRMQYGSCPGSDDKNQNDGPKLCGVHPFGETPRRDAFTGRSSTVVFGFSTFLIYRAKSAGGIDI